MIEPAKQFDKWAFNPVMEVDSVCGVSCCLLSGVYGLAVSRSLNSMVLGKSSGKPRLVWHCVLSSSNVFAAVLSLYARTTSC